MTHTPQHTSDPVLNGLDRCLHALASGGGDLPQHANRIGQILWSPPRVVITGRVKAGKSTLVNALVGAPVAQTGALETTRVVSVYQDGAPARTIVAKRDGSWDERQVRPDETRPDSFGCPPEDIRYVHRILPSAALRALTLIDTPGLSAISGHGETTRAAFIEGMDQTRTASVEADAAIFCFDSTPRADEIAFLRELGFTPLNTLGVLSRADTFGEGAFGDTDPLDEAARHAQVLAQQLSSTVMTVVPVSGLLGQTAHCGQVTEHDARTLQQLAHINGFPLADLLDSDAPEPLSEGDRNRLLGNYAEYGIVYGRDHAAGGADTLASWMMHRSGVPQLSRVLHEAFRFYATLGRADRLLAEFDTLAYTHPARDHIRTVVHQARSDSALLHVWVFRALKGLLKEDPNSALVAELTALLKQPTVAQQLGLPAEAPHQQVRAIAQQRLARVQHHAIQGGSAAEDTALAVLNQVYTAISRS
ncbi:50S ribosome-binding GTPase [Hoyosella rhizosphaerae]|uniref:GTPase n=1 Tax=Hoyosella rhizosphaerae TaxID=1755582 RepID=A0A916XFM2_9ACTN|nr:dynamin family protein [Hoyosella rhizosphaerae]MBN4925545.1 50S ribosome-binding GTPase [Hoyosella rhizosphaerae]GGC69824.1 GTPase [Hoyosella rhizosphaerae]